jgi:hypothetical protein
MTDWGRNLSGLAVSKTLQNFFALYQGQIPRLSSLKTHLLVSQLMPLGVAERPVASWLTVEPE